MWRNAQAWAMYSPRRSFQGSKLHRNTESPRIPRLQPRRTVRIQPKDNRI